MILMRFFTLCSLIGQLTLPVFVEAKYQLFGVQTGIDRQTGARPARRNILDLQNDIPTWSLYIQALTAMQQTTESDLLSYFQIAGIHGRPYYAWDGYEQDPTAPLIGYCTHYDILFPIWHRPYVALFEQILANHTQRIAKTYNSSLYQTAADNFRVPYWDWASIPTMPDAVTAETVTINTPVGPQEVENPLLTYRFQNFPLNSTWFPNDQDGSLSTKPNTVRCQSANSALANGNLMKDTYSIFSQVLDWDTMATGNIAGRSFEYSHNEIHQCIGSGRAPVIIGHMGTFTYSAFDPIFWLHHANIDRLFAMWEAINPNEFLTPSTECDLASGTFTIPIGSPLTINTPLTPFTSPSNNNQTIYTPTTSRLTRYFGYSYPEIQDWLPRTRLALAANVTAAINMLYNPNGTFGSNITTPSRQGLESGKVREWSVGLHALNTALNDRYVISVYLGPSTSNKVGEMLVVPPPIASLRWTTNHVLDLNDILKAGGVDTEDVAAVVSTLRRDLKWTVTKGDGALVNNDAVEGLSIAVFDSVVTLPKNVYEFPKHGNRTAYPQITSGEAGGSDRDIWP